MIKEMVPSLPPPLPLGCIVGKYQERSGILRDIMVQILERDKGFERRKYLHL